MESEAISHEASRKILELVSKSEFMRACIQCIMQAINAQTTEDSGGYQMDDVTANISQWHMPEIFLSCEKIRFISYTGSTGW